MPPMKVCGQRWLLGSDDLVISTVLLAVFHAGAIIAVFTIVSLPLGRLPLNIKALMYALAACNGISTLVDVMIAWLSSRGSILDAAPRAKVPALLVVHFIILPFRIGVYVALAVVMMVLRSVTLTPVPWEYWFCVAWMGAYGVLFLLELIVAVATFLGKTSGEMPLRVVLRVFRLAECILGEGSGESMELVTKSFTVFLERLEVVPSDIAAGFALVRDAQWQAQHGAYPTCLTDLGRRDASVGYPWDEEDEKMLKRSCGGTLPMVEPVLDREILEDLLHNLCFAVASYGWVLQSFTWSSDLACGCLCSRYSRSGEMSNEETQKVRWNMRGVLSCIQNWPGHRDTQVVFLSSVNQVKCSPYAIFADHSKRTVVVAVRGSLSVEDWITNFLVDHVDITETDLAGNLPGGPHTVVTGMWEAAQSIYKDIQRWRVVGTLFNGGGFDVEMGTFPARDASQASGDSDESENESADEGDSPLIMGCRADKHVAKELPDCTGYELLVTGHSLGGGIAGLLGAMLKSDIPNTRVITYSAPPTCSRALAEHLATYQTACLLGDDLVPRVTARTLHKFRDMMLLLAAHCPESKFRVTWGGVAGKCLCRCCCSGGLRFTDEPVSNQALDVLRKHSSKEAPPPQLHGGRLVYLKPLHGTVKRCCLHAKGKAKFRACWCLPEDLQEIVMSSCMIMHHVPDSLRDALKSALRELDRSTSSTSDSDSEESTGGQSEEGLAN